ncbi:ABC transporter permease [Streptomyces sp. NBC_01260]|uniref:ABC transporter permease n=1 Tax=unclassified Streptomyces TaxID=2593676 RepID=UPI000F47C795|nr:MULTISPECIES: ABC transporter permease [unclassified Streptomyces]MCX4771079.1 ABC transporter permease [Streptomyces sp. NBC_01285]ROQ81534.1 ABC-2 type transport system permease protein [Streptomyces sp. CEV 2-1]
MTTATTRPNTATAGAPATTVRGRLTALGRAELTLLARNRTALFVALLMPAAMVTAMRSTFEQMDLGGTGLTVAGAALTGGIGTVLIQAVYMNMVAAYVARREELVLKRLRTGEVTDGEILTGTALPAAALALAQTAVIVVAGTAFFGLGAPEHPELLLLGLVTGVVLLTALAAATSVITRTVQTAQLTTLPLFFASMMGSGLFVPLEILPDRLASVCELLPLTGVMTLVRAGWLGGAEGTELLGAALTGLVWTVLAVFAVKRWFRWDPRR